MNIVSFARRFVFSAAALVALLGVAGCGRTIDPKVRWGEIVTQVSTLPALSGGHYQGQMAVSNLVAFGDHGLGTFDALDGEMVLHGGTVYRVGVDCVPVPAAPDAMIPFAQVTWFVPDAVYDVMSLDQKLFTSTMAWKQPDRGHMLAVRVSGLFSELRVRSVPRQSEPYQPLDRVTAEQQVERAFEKVSGSMIGFFTPAALGTVSPAGFHFHFISNDGKIGGHVLDFKLAAGRIEVDETPELRVLLPSLPPADPAFPAKR